MKSMTGAELREAFLSYFEDEEHTRAASSSLIPVGDPTLLLTTAGMVQFKPYFAGQTTPPNVRMTTSQKSFRTDDIDEVGDATHLTLFEMLGNFSFGDYFKGGAMDYALDFILNHLGLEKERCSITVHETDEDSIGLWMDRGIPQHRIYKFGDKDNWWGPAGDEGSCGPNSEIHYDIGDARGCGQSVCAPNCTNTFGAYGETCQRFVEIWNLVFMEFYHHLDGERTHLPAPGVDTGMGLERTTAILQGVQTIYETDLFWPLVEKVEELTGKSYGEDHETDYVLRVLADHARGAAFLVADGVAPGNEGRGYVVRRVIRRAIRHARRLGLNDPFLGDVAEVVVRTMGDVFPELRNNEAFITTVLKLEEERFQRTLGTALGIFHGTLKAWRDEVKSALDRQLTPDFKNALEQQDVIRTSRRVQEAAKVFLRSVILTHTLGAGHRDAIEEAQQPIVEMVEALSERADNHIHGDSRESYSEYISGLIQDFEELTARVERVTKQIQGFEAFVLYDAYGLPVEETEAVARDIGIVNGVDIDGFQREMAAQRERARASANFGGDQAKIRVYESLGITETEFAGFTTLTDATVVVGLISDDQVVSQAVEGDDVEVVLIKTPFYPEGGGQVGDGGTIECPDGRIEVRDTQNVMAHLIIHYGTVTRGTVSLGDPADAYVDPVRREDTARNHTATHLLHAALRQVLGPHVRQAGSLVAPDRLRFDFTHVQPMTPDEVRDTQFLVNEKIRQNAKVLKSEDSYTRAIERGALAFFGDKYEAQVRLIEIANGDTFSFEVCGGTHVGQTGELGSLFILGEVSIGAGVRRIEAVSGRGAEQTFGQQRGILEYVSRELQTGMSEVAERIQRLLEENAELRRERDVMQRRMSLQSAEGLLDSKQDVDGVAVVSTRVNAESTDSLREIGDWLRDKHGSGVVVLGAVINDRPSLVAMVTQDLVKAGVSADTLVKGAAKAIQGGGGGRPDVAQAGGRRAEKLDEALSLVPGLVREATLSN